MPKADERSRGDRLGQEDGEVRAAIGQCGFKLLHEQTLTTDFRQSAIENLIATCRHSEDFYVTRWI